VEHSGRTVVLAARVSPGAGPGAGTPILFADGLALARDGAVYFTDAVALAPRRLPSGGYDAMGVAAEALLTARQPALGCRVGSGLPPPAPWRLCSRRARLASP